MKKTVTVIGLGYIGLPTSIVLAESEFDVFGYDKNLERIQTIISLESILSKEPQQLEKLIKVLGRNLHVDSKLIEAEVYLIVVPTPINNKVPDLSYVNQAVKSLIPILKSDDLVILESTSPVGTTEQISKQIFEMRPELKNNIHIAYCPERVIPGNTFYELEFNDRVIGGINKTSSEKASSFYSHFVKGNLHETNSKTAELCKLTENSYRDHQIAFANELSIICDEEEVNPFELIDLANKHPRISMLKPSCGVGGHCIAIDPWFLISNYENSQLIEKSRETNLNKTTWCIDKIKSECLSFESQNQRKPSLALMGLSYKPNVDDFRESPALEIAKNLLQDQNYYQSIFVVEPNVDEVDDIQLCKEEDRYTNADLIVFLVAHNEFEKIIKKVNSKSIIDFCGINSKPNE